MTTIAGTPVFFDCVPTLFDEIEVIHGKLAAKAYEYFLERGCVDGHDVDDWLRAENQLLLKAAVELHYEDRGFVVGVDLPDTDPNDLRVCLTPEELLVSSIPRGDRQIFSIVRFPEAIDPVSVDVVFAGTKLHVAATTAGEFRARSFATVA